MFSFDQNTLSQMSLTGQIAGMFQSAAGSYYSAASQRSNLQFQADMAEINARMSESSAQSALLQGQKQVGAISMQAGKIKRSQRAAMAANGIDVGVGNAAETMASTELMKEIDMNTAEANAVMSAWGYRVQGTSYQNQANIGRASAGAVSPFASAASSLINGATSVASSWYSMKKLGLMDTPSGAGQFNGVTANSGGYGLSGGVSLPASFSNWKF